MKAAQPIWRSLLTETLATSGAYLAAFAVTFGILMPIQGTFFPDFYSQASLLYLPNGIRILAAWLLGWRSPLALLPGVVTVFVVIGGDNIFLPSRLGAIAAMVLVAPATLHALKLAGWDISPRPGHMPCWPCVMAAGIVISVLSGILFNLSMGSPVLDYFAFVIGDVAGLFFMMMILMLFFRSMRLRSS